MKGSFFKTKEVEDSILPFRTVASLKFFEARKFTRNKEFLVILIVRLCFADNFVFTISFHFAISKKKKKIYDLLLSIKRSP